MPVMEMTQKEEERNRGKNNELVRFLFLV